MKKFTKRFRLPIAWTLSSKKMGPGWPVDGLVANAGALVGIVVMTTANAVAIPQADGPDRANPPIVVKEFAKAKPIDPSMVPDPDWGPRPGDRAVLYDEGGHAVIVATEMSAFPEAIRLARAGDGDGLSGLEKYGLIARVPSGTSIRVIRVHDKQLAVIRKHDDRLVAEGVPTIEAQILDGDREGESVWVSQPWATSLIHKGRLPVARPEREAIASALKPKPKRPDAATRAANALNVGGLLENARRIEQAIEAYREVIRNYPGTPSAEVARKRIDDLAGNP